MIKEENTEFKSMLTGIGVIFLYIISSSLFYELLTILGIDYKNLSELSKQTYSVVYEVLLLFVIVFIYRKNVIPNFKDFIKNIKNYFKKYIKYWFIALGLMIMSNIIITAFTTTLVSENQRIVLEELNRFPIYTFIISVCIAPIIEELVFRLSFRKIFAHTNYLFILFSGVFFGAIHVLGSTNSLIDLLFIIPYSIPGFIFAYTYSKSKNIFVPITLHFIHNLIMIIIQLIF